MLIQTRNQVNFNSSRLKTPSYTYSDLDYKKGEWVRRTTKGYFLGWENRRPNGTCTPMWYARFSRVLVPMYCLTRESLLALPDLPVGEKVVV